MGKASAPKIAKTITSRFTAWKNNQKVMSLGRRSYSIFLFLVLTIVGTYFFPRNKSFQYSSYQVGTVALEEIIAPEHIPILKVQEEIDNEKEQARNRILLRFTQDRETENQAEENFNAFFDNVEEYIDLKKRESILLKRPNSGGQQTDSVLTAQLDNLRSQFEKIETDLKQQYNIDVENASWSFVRAMDKNAFNSFRQNCFRILRDLISVGMVNVGKHRPEFTNIDLTLKRDGGEFQRNINDFFDQAESRSEISIRLQNIYTVSTDTISVGFEIIQNFLIPNIKYDPIETENLRNEAAAKVPLTRGFVQQNERIVDKNERITEDHFRKIESLRTYLSEQRSLQGALSQLTFYIGQWGFLALCFLLFGAYLYQFRPAILKDNNKLTIIFLIFFTQIIFIYLVTQNLQLSEYLIPTSIGSILLAILFDGGIGFYGSVVISLLVGGFIGNDFSIAVYALAGGAVAVMTVRRIRNRSQFFRSAIYIFLVYTATIYVIGIMRMIELSDITSMVFTFSLPNALFSPLIALGFMAFFELAFGVTTDMTLLELSDLNRPLLRELAMRAPGTYHHSIVLGNLSERAAEAIGANSLLARVGCYYHDIGKMVKPEYFIENDPEAMKRHEALSPSMSSLIISAHVREGVEIAEKYKLPNVIKDFIMQHHGTGKISFFYEKAIEKSGKKDINPADYCYPGPKPQTKETGIVMLADSVEAATRALKDPSSARIKERVNSLIGSRFTEGQLDSCELTLKDLRAISESFIQILTGMFHVRIEYPEDEKGNGKKAVEVKKESN